MNIKINISIIFISISLSLFSQINVDNTIPYDKVQYLVDEVLIGEGVKAFNIQYFGADAAVGYFKNGNSTGIGIDEGIIITSGNIYDATGPNNASGTTTNYGRAGYNKLNNLLTSQTTKDAAYIKFDFIPKSDTVKFRYVFASEEYNEFVDDIFNDIFAFFLSGPNPNGGNYTDKNIALIPGTNDFVSINNVNNGYSNSFAGGPCNNCTYFVDNYGNSIINTVQYDGYTTVLTAIAEVVPCQTYTIILAIADVVDGQYDSGVFLEASSFSSSDVTASSIVLFPDVTAGENSTTIKEGISTINIDFERNSTVGELIVSLNTSGLAINGTDYTTIPNEIVFTEGVKKITLSINAFLDNIPEGLEDLILKYKFTDICESSGYTEKEIKINIIDEEPIDFNSPDLCFKDTSFFQIINHNTNVDSVLWNFGDPASGTKNTSKELNPHHIFTSAGNYNVTLSWFIDDPVPERTVTKNIHVHALPSSQIFEDNIVCRDDNFKVYTNLLTTHEISLDKIDDWYWNFCDLQVISGTAAGKYNLKFTNKDTCDITLYTKSFFGCYSDTTSFRVINPDSLIIDSFSKKDLRCFNENDGQIFIEAHGGIPSLKYSKDGTTYQNSNKFYNLPANNYTISVKDVNNCVHTTANIDISSPAELKFRTIDGIVIKHISCHDYDDGEIEIFAEGGTAPFNYSLETIGTNLTGKFSNLAGMNYTVKVVDDSLCEISKTVEVLNPDSIIIDYQKITNNLCYGDTLGKIELHFTGGWQSCPDNGDECFFKNYTWNNGKSTKDINKLSIGNYTLTITDFNDCVREFDFEITQPDSLYINNIDTKNVNCYNGFDGYIHYDIVGGISPYSFTWSNDSISKNLDNIRADGYYLTLKDSNLCAVNYSFTITQPPPISNIFISNTDSVSCYGYSDGKIEINLGGFAYNTAWSNGATNVNAISNLKADWYFVEIDNGSKCHILDTTVYEPDKLQISINERDTICVSETDIIIPTITGGTATYNYFWSNANDSILSPLITTEYTLTITDKHSCTADTNFFVKVFDKLKTNIEVVPEIVCPMDSSRVKITSIGGTSQGYEYFINSKKVDNILNFVVAKDTNITIITNDINCSDTAKSIIKLRAFNPPNIREIIIERIAMQGFEDFFTSKDSIIKGEEIELSAKVDADYNLISYIWQSPDKSKLEGNYLLLMPKLSGNYYLTVTDENQCIDTLSKELFVVDPTLFIPNAFTPNGDGYNDFWEIGNLNMYPTASVSIFNRLGLLVYSTDDYLKNPWDGTYKNVLAPSTTYYFVLSLQDIFETKTKRKYSGDITIFR